MYCFILRTGARPRPLALCTTLLLSCLIQAIPDGILTTPANTSCRSIPGDLSWPSQFEWAQLNDTVQGRLKATIPLAAVCHDPDFDHEVCQKLKEEWIFAATHIHTPAEFTAPYFQNNSCDPYSSQESPCAMGNYAPYSIDVAKVSDVQAALSFAHEKNIRLTIKNTGHDLLGKSTGKGALSLWTHNMKSIDFINRYDGHVNYSGPAVRLGAGVLTEDIFAAANSSGVRVITGTCPTVGVAGGYTSGGGHGVFTSRYGMAADNVLEWEVVTAAGQHLVATPTDPSTRDLYWALSGGGAGTFAVVISMTTRVYPDGPIAGAGSGFNVESAGGIDEYWHAVAAFQSSLGPVTDAGAVASYVITSNSLTLISVAMPNKNITKADEILRPVQTALADIGIPLELNITSHPSFLDFFNYYFMEAVTTTPDAQITGSRFFPRDLIENATNSDTVSQAFRAATDAGFTIICDAINANKTPPYVNAVSAGWRSALLHCIIVQSWNFSIPWSDMIAQQDRLTNIVMPQIEAAAPGGGAYLNEANFEQADWQEVFYSSNYPRLKIIKEKYDPKGIFYARTAVGSEGWAENADGRLCQT